MKKRRGGAERPSVERKKLLRRNIDAKAGEARPPNRPDRPGWSPLEEL
jgi:hypothetical protein